MSTWSEYFSACVYGRLLSCAGIAAHLLNTCVAYDQQQQQQQQRQQQQEDKEEEEEQEEEQQQQQSWK